jgi:hypothetical protein
MSCWSHYVAQFEAVIVSEVTGRICGISFCDRYLPYLYRLPISVIAANCHGEVLHT